MLYAEVRSTFLYRPVHSSTAMDYFNLTNWFVLLVILIIPKLGATKLIFILSKFKLSFILFLINKPIIDGISSPFFP